MHTWMEPGLASVAISTIRIVIHMGTLSGWQSCQRTTGGATIDTNISAMPECCWYLSRFDAMDEFVNGDVGNADADVCRSLIS
eukprot:CAMPEP_0183352478 /NCGR_PEP_ID=MMETSP0164_2-20130417/29467_1 /TAXON_ID=221442 /ORGANISM="Coccolithus pelagicus ssp braarudi, Strain PLY182g" /LENGTH=82 /DNA_ID=CAMNT_0025524919 /DNA_START=186 /DNA_END=432 /DNA_ORIENTATION=-